MADDAQSPTKEGTSQWWSRFGEQYDEHAASEPSVEGAKRPEPKAEEVLIAHAVED